MPYTARVIDSLHDSSSPECRSIFEHNKSVNCDELSSLEKVLSDDTDLTFEELDESIRQYLNSTAPMWKLFLTTSTIKTLNNPKQFFPICGTRANQLGVVNFLCTGYKIVHHNWLLSTGLLMNSQTSCPPPSITAPRLKPLLTNFPG